MEKEICLIQTQNCKRLQEYKHFTTFMDIKQQQCTKKDIERKKREAMARKQMCQTMKGIGDVNLNRNNLKTMEDREETEEIWKVMKAMLLI